MVEIQCKWCGKKFFKNQIDVTRDKFGEYPLLICPHCTKILPASRKIKLDSSTGKQHVHFDYVDGDIA